MKQGTFQNNTEKVVSETKPGKSDGLRNSALPNAREESRKAEWEEISAKKETMEEKVS